LQNCDEYLKFGTALLHLNHRNAVVQCCPVDWSGVCLRHWKSEFLSILAAYCGAAGIAAALLRRANEGGSYQVRVSLTRMCMWAQEVGLLDASAMNGTRPFADVVRESNLPLARINGPFGEISYLPSMIEMPDIKPGFVRSTQPLGSSLLEWVD